RGFHLLVALFGIVEQADVARRHRGAHLATREAGHEPMIDRGRSNKPVATVIEFDLARERFGVLPRELETVDMTLVDALFASDHLDERFERLVGRGAIEEPGPRAERFLAGGAEFLDRARACGARVSRIGEPVGGLDTADRLLIGALGERVV